MKIKIDVTDDNLSKTHEKTESIAFEDGFWFKDLEGNPMWIQNVKVTTWTAKINKNNNENI